MEGRKHGMDGIVERHSAGLDELEKIARHDLARLNYPPANWVPERPAPTASPVLDVLIVGAGMCGQTVGWGLLREGIRNIRVIERNTHGHEGPWNTTARMPILRSPKHLTGPDLGVPSLTFRAWYEAQHGAEGWEKLYKIAAPRLALLPSVGAQGRRPEGRERRVAAQGRGRRRLPAGEPVDRRDRACAQDRAGQRPRRIGRLPLAVVPLVRSRRSRPRRPRLSHAGRDRFHQTQGQAPRHPGRAGDGDRQCLHGARSRRARGDLLRAAAAPAAGQQVEGRVLSRLPARPGHAGRRLALEDLHLHAGRRLAAAARIGAAGAEAAGLRLPLRRAVARHDRRHGRRHREDDEGHGALRRRADRHRLRHRSRAAARNSRRSPPT